MASSLPNAERFRTELKSFQQELEQASKGQRMFDQQSMLATLNFGKGINIQLGVVGALDGKPRKKQ